MSSSDEEGAENESDRADEDQVPDGDIDHDHGETGSNIEEATDVTFSLDELAADSDDPVPVEPKLLPVMHRYTTGQQKTAKKVKPVITKGKKGRGTFIVDEEDLDKEDADEYDPKTCGEQAVTSQQLYAQ